MSKTVLAIDVGNTNIVVGLLIGGVMKSQWRIRTVADRTKDEYMVLFERLFTIRGLSLDDIDDAIVSSVVPPAERGLVDFFGLLSIDPLVVGPGTKTGMRILYDNPREVGADRIVNAVAAFERIKGGAIVVDFGTATTWDVINEQGEYMGGVIAPGIGISSEALFRRAAKLPRVDLTAPAQVLAKDTVSAMQSGLIFGYAGMVDSITLRLRKELGVNWPAMATGGTGKLVIDQCSEVTDFLPDLTIEGLAVIYSRNR